MHDLEIATPEEERLWSCATAEQWQEFRHTRVVGSHKTIREVMVDIISGRVDVDAGSASEPYNVSGFAALTVMHAVNIQMWHMIQFTQSFDRFSSPSIGKATNWTILLATASSALARCQATIAHSQPAEHEPSWDDPEGPLMFNCQAMLRIAHCRLLTDPGNLNRLILLTDDPTQIKNSITSYVTAKQERTPFLIKALAKAYEGFLTPVKIGHLLVSKTAAFSWSVEHAVAGWDSGKQNDVTNMNLPIANTSIA